MLPLVLAVLCMFQALPQSPADNPPPPVEVNSIEADEHRIGDPWHYIRVNSKAAQIYAGVSVETVVDTTGSVVSSTGWLHPVIKVPPGIIAQAEALVRELHYKRFERHGHPVTARFYEFVQLLPPELKPVRHVPFPHVKDWKSVKITLKRTECYGECPAYSIEVHGDGSVLYEGESNVAFTGKHRGLISRDNVIELVRQFEQADFYSLRAEYKGGVTDNSTKVTSIAIDGRRKQLTDYVGLETGMPLAVSELEDTIDRLANSARWTQGNAETLAALEGEHWDFKSAEAADTLARVARYGKAEVVRDLVSAGVPINGQSDSDNATLVQAATQGDAIMLRTLLEAGAGTNASNLANAVVAAAGSGKIDALRVLLNAGGNIKSRDDLNRTALMAAATSGSPAMVEEVLKSHPDVNARTSCDSGCDGSTALLQLTINNFYNVTREDVMDVVHLLLQAGADVNARDEHGNTALIVAVMFNADLVSALLEAGADVNAHNDEGKTAFDNTDDEDTKKMLRKAVISN